MAKNKGWREKPDESGKAPVHRAVQVKNRCKDVLKEPMSLREDQYQDLYKAEPWHNPYHINVDGKEYELKNIIIYKPDGTLLQVRRGWFGRGDNGRTRFPIPTAVKRIKPKFDGQTFIVPKPRARYEKEDKPHAWLYIPYGYFDFEVSAEDEKLSGGRIKRIPLYISRRVRLRVDEHGTPLEVLDFANTEIRAAPKKNKDKSILGVNFKDYDRTLEFLREHLESEAEEAGRDPAAYMISMGWDTFAIDRKKFENAVSDVDKKAEEIAFLMIKSVGAMYRDDDSIVEHLLWELSGMMPHDFQPDSKTADKLGNILSD